jgi:hypothetical protein
VPALTGDVLRSFVRGDDQDLGVAVRPRRMAVQLAEQAAEGLVILVRKGLVAKDDDVVLDQRRVDLGEQFARCLPARGRPLRSRRRSTD